MQLQPYVFFEGRCEEALNFYKKALGAEVKMMMRFKDAPDPAMCPPNMGEKIMHGEARIGNSSLMASDGHCQQSATFTGFSLSLTPDTEAEATKYFNALSDGGKVQMPLSKTFFAKSFGMVADKFGVSWMIYVPAQH